MNQSECLHHNLLLLPSETKNRLRCRHCHLTIKADELETRYCPECYEATGRKRSDFDEVEPVEAGQVQYRCEDCGLFIEV